MSPGFVEYSEVVGKILANLQALELSLRQYLYKQDSPEVMLRTPFNDLAVGDVVPENAMTDWSTLGQLIDRYNKCLSKSLPALAVDRSVVDIRDALAHCRMYLPDIGAAPVLLKFEKPVSGQTRVIFLQVSSSQWLEGTISRVHREIAKVQEALGHA